MWYSIEYCQKSKIWWNQRRLASVIYNFFDKKSSGSGTKNENISNKELAEQLHKPIVRKLRKNYTHSL